MSMSMSMSDEQFEYAIGHFIVEIQEQMRARDTAQREALARVEAERDGWKEQRDILADYCRRADERARTAQAQLAEAVEFIKQVSEWPNGGSTYGQEQIKLSATAFLARHAQAEQQEAPKRGRPDWNSHGYDQIFQTSDGNWFGARAGWDFKGHISDQWKGREVSLLRDDGGFLAYGEPNPDWESSLEQRPVQEAQGEQAGEFWTWLGLAYRDGSKGEGRNFTKHNMEVAYRAGTEVARAALATQPSAGEPVAWMTWPLRGFAAGKPMICNSNEPRNPELWKKPFPVYAAPPAAAHGDEAVRKDAARYRWLTEDLKDSQSRIARNLILQRMPVMSYSAASTDIDAAMHAQGDGETKA